MSQLSGIAAVTPDTIGGVQCDSGADPLSYLVHPPEQVRMIDLFAGPGGLDVAAKWLGINAIGIERDNDACRTRVAAKLGTRHADVRQRDLLDEYRNATILTGGPPCQTYSVAGSGVGRQRLDEVLRWVRRMGEHGPHSVEDEIAELTDERTGLVLEPLVWALLAIEKERPFEAIVLEQVTTVLPVWLEYAKVLEGLGYQARAEVLHAEEFGVPQTRRRAILVARRNQSVAWPAPTHRRFVRGGPFRPGDEDKLACVPMNAVLDRTGEYVVVSNYGTGGRPEIRGRRRFDEPAYTVTSKVFRNRVRSLDEHTYLGHVDRCDAERLQTFPHNYPWRGKDIAQQIGNAIPPRLAVHVLAAAVFGRRPSAKALDRVIRAKWGMTVNADGEALIGCTEELDRPTTLYGVEILKNPVPVL